MAVKKFLTENGKQVWPITRTDCVYTVDGDRLLSEDYASKEFVNNMLSGLRLVQITKAEYEALTEKDPSVLYIVIN